MKAQTLLLAIIGIVIFQSCRDINISGFDEAQLKWQNLNAKKYAYDYQVDCFCFFTEPARIVVENNAIVEILDVNTGNPMVNPLDSNQLLIDDIPGNVYTVEQLFDNISRGRREADILNTTFDEVHGFPSSIYIDWMKDAYDDEISYQMSNFEVL